MTLMSLGCLCLLIIVSLAGSVWQHVALFEEGDLEQNHQRVGCGVGWAWIPLWLWSLLSVSTTKCLTLS